MKTKEQKYQESVSRHMEDFRKNSSYYIKIYNTLAELKHKLSIRANDINYDDEILSRIGGRW